MGRCRFVQPEVVRLPLADVHRRALADLQAKAADKKIADKDKPTAEALALAAARLTDSEADGQWVDVKKRLNTRETRRVFTRLVKKYEAGEKIELDPEFVGITKLVEYLVNWSLTNADGESEPPTQEAIENLDDETFREISEAIDHHEQAQQTAREHETKNRAGANISG